MSYPSSSTKPFHSTNSGFGIVIVCGTPFRQNQASRLLGFGKDQLSGLVHEIGYDVHIKTMKESKKRA